VNIPVGSPKFDVLSQDLLQIRGATGDLETMRGAINTVTAHEPHMIWWDKCRSFLLRADRSFQLWVDRLPEWGLILLLPPIVLVLVVEWACYFRRTTAVAAVTFVAVDVSLIRSGAIAFSWGEALSGLGRGCIEVMGLLYFVVLVLTLLMALWRLQEALRPSTEAKESPERTRASFGLWDREIDW
jgi:hypothetical protein